MPCTGPAQPRTLRALLAPDTCARWRAAAAAAWPPERAALRLAEVLAPAEVLSAMAAMPALRALAAGLPLCNVDQCWWRRGRPPHQWHQDGALHHDFSAIQADAAAPLPMRTCWIALTPCGTDAPGLEWVEPGPPALLLPDALTDAAVQARGGRRRHAVLAAGDALLFDGALLHRTHLTPAMTAPRLSLELRLFPDPPPAAVAHERLLRWA